MSTASTKVWLVLCGCQCFSRESAGNWETSHDHQALLLLPLTCLYPQFRYLVWRAISSGFMTIYFLWHPQQGWFWTLICFQILHKYLRSTFLFFPKLHSFPFLGGSKLILPLPWLSFMSFLRPGVAQCPQNPGQACIKPETSPCCWHWTTKCSWLWDNLSDRPQYMSQRPQSKML